EFPTPAARAALAKLIAAHGDDRWFRVAVLTSVANQPAEFLSSAAKHRDFLMQLAQLIGARRQPNEIEALLAKAGDNAQALNGLGRGMRLSGGPRMRSAAAEAAFRRVLDSPDPQLQEAAWRAARHFDMPAVFSKAVAGAARGVLPAVRALGGVDPAQAVPVLEKLLSDNPTAELQAAAVGALTETGDARTPAILLNAWKSLRADARTRAVNGLVGRKEWAGKLLDAIAGNQVEPAGVEIAARVRLLESPDAGLAQRAKALFAASATNRGNVVNGYMGVLSLSADAGRGKAVFEEHCSRCHLPRKQGGRVGPDLSGVNNKTKEQLLSAILDPSAAIEPRFVNYMVTAKDGQMYDGVIANETPAAITLRGGTEEGDQSILRKNVAEVRASAISLMPEEFEKTINQQQMADLIAYLRAGL
ncbi:MAG: c-type cytochrome, partial [Alphaproteobacteria bacterium]|nr:c-type cytochrome [Alphaproteobacteria bacterium]